MNLQFFVYYRVKSADLGAVLDILRDLHEKLNHATPGLTISILRRPEVSSGDVTLMETYTGADGMDSDLVVQIAEITSSLAPWLRSQRHIETFQLLGRRA